MDRTRRIWIAGCVLAFVGAACSSNPATVLESVKARNDDVRFPVGLDEDPYLDPETRDIDVRTAPRSRTGRRDGTTIEIPPYPGRIRRDTPSICGAEQVITTGTKVQFPWAPPCVEHRLADSATSRGVTARKIRVAYYVSHDPKIEAAARNSGGCGSPACRERYARAYTAWFSRYFDLSGREIELEIFAGAASESDPRLADADADALADLGVFAVLNGPGEAGPRFAARLASRGVLCVCTLSLPEEFYTEHSPYVWSWLMSSTQAYIHRVDYIAKRLAGRKARWAGTPAMRARDRSFGLVWFDNTDNDYAPGVSFFSKRLAALGVPLAASVEYTNIQGCQTSAASIVRQLQDAHVTSVLFVGDPLCPTPLTNAAQAAGATWEWIITGSVLTDTNNFARLYDQSQWGRAFGVSMLRPTVRTASDYWAKMLAEIDPSIEPKSDAMGALEPFTPFFTGVHLAGPDLTPWTFRKAMYALPGTGGSVTIPQRSYGPRTVEGVRLTDNTSYDDMTEIWWDPDSMDPDGGTGAYRYVSRGKRFAWGAWPATAPDVFNRTTAIVGYVRAPDQ